MSFENAPGPPTVPAAAVLSFLVVSAFFEVSAVNNDWRPPVAVSLTAAGVPDATVIFASLSAASIRGSDFSSAWVLSVIWNSRYADF